EIVPAQIVSRAARSEKSQFGAAAAVILLVALPLLALFGAVLVNTRTRPEPSRPQHLTDGTRLISPDERQSTVAGELAKSEPAHDAAPSEASPLATTPATHTAAPGKSNPPRPCE